MFIKNFKKIARKNLGFVSDNIKQILDFISVKNQVTNIDHRLKGTKMDPLDKNGINYKQPLRHLTAEEVAEYITKRRKRKDISKVFNRRKLKKAQDLQAYIDRKNRERL